jgi:hypothetical protein
VQDLSQEEYDRLSREGKCFRCKQTGHPARNCQSDPNKQASASSSSSGN